MNVIERLRTKASRRILIPALALATVGSFATYQMVKSLKLRAQQRRHRQQHHWTLTASPH